MSDVTRIDPSADELLSALADVRDVEAAWFRALDAGRRCARGSLAGTLLVTFLSAGAKSVLNTVKEQIERRLEDA